MYTIKSEEDFVLIVKNYNIFESAIKIVKNKKRENSNHDGIEENMVQPKITNV